MNKKIAIIGGGLFGVTSYIKLKNKGYDCVLFEKKKDILLGASTNNLNRIHFGYHYPRDDQTAQQSYKGYKKFYKFFKKSVVKNFENYYAIAKESKIDFQTYLKFCKKNSLKYKNVNLKKFKIRFKNITGCVRVKEPIYDWNLITKEVKEKILKLSTNKIKKNETVKKIIKKNKYFLITNKQKYVFDVIVDASYDQSNRLIKKIFIPKKRKYQLVVVFEFYLKNFEKMGLAIMDGNFFSFLPKGNGNKHLIYHVKHSIIKQQISKYMPDRWLKFSKKSKKIFEIKKKIESDLNKYCTNLKIKFSKNVFINPRVIEKGVEKTDRRISTINEINKSYFQIFSAKIDHSIDIADNIVKRVSKKI